MNRVVQMALNARTNADVATLEEELGRSGAHRVRFLGDRDTNWSTLSNAADPKGLIFERATNELDALIELEVQRQRPKLAMLSSPAVAAQKLFGLPSSG